MKFALFILIVLFVICGAYIGGYFLDHSTKDYSGIVAFHNVDELNQFKLELFDKCLTTGHLAQKFQVLTPCNNLIVVNFQAHIPANLSLSYGEYKYDKNARIALILVGGILSTMFTVMALWDAK